MRKVSKETFTSKIAAALRIEADRIEREGDFGHTKDEWITPKEVRIYSHGPYVVDYHRESHYEGDEEGNMTGGVHPFLQHAMLATAGNISDLIDL
tara:strand:- start:2288 stop:2572 length:285 start_codon:yes stop_codon:yes gene_type:complete